MENLDDFEPAKAMHEFSAALWRHEATKLLNAAVSAKNAIEPYSAGEPDLHKAMWHLEYIERKCRELLKG